MVERKGERNVIDLERKSKYLWHRLTKTDLQGVGAVDAEMLKRHLVLKGFDLSRKIERITDIDSLYYKQERA